MPEIKSVSQLVFLVSGVLSCQMTSTALVFVVHAAAVTSTAPGGQDLTGKETKRLEMGSRLST